MNPNTSTADQQAWVKARAREIADNLVDRDVTNYGLEGALRIARLRAENAKLTAAALAANLPSPEVHGDALDDEDSQAYVVAREIFKARVVTGGGRGYDMSPAEWKSAKAQAKREWEKGVDARGAAISRPLFSNSEQKYVDHRAPRLVAEQKD